MHTIFWNIVEAANVAVEMLIVLLYFSKLFAPSYEYKRIYICGYSAAAFGANLLKIRHIIRYTLCEVIGNDC